MRKIYTLAILLTLLSSCANDNTLKYSKEEFGKKWPFSVDEIEVYCDGYKEIYCKASDGKIYALNGSAKTASKDNPNVSKIENIWLDDPEFEGLKIPYVQFITEGLKLCKDK